MKITIASDEKTHLTDAVIEAVRERGHEIQLFGPLIGEGAYWSAVAQQAAESVASGESDEGILFCWTGTGISLAANKVPGIRAALCADAETARGARLWKKPMSCVCPFEPQRRWLPKRYLKPGLTQNTSPMTSMIHAWPR
jgi:RpiB/LacA/LacB family sugar-phosphate isomerase